jgi:hypothetical protein
MVQATPDLTGKLEGDHSMAAERLNEIRTEVVSVSSVVYGQGWMAHIPTERF